MQFITTLFVLQNLLNKKYKTEVEKTYLNFLKTEYI